MGRAAFGVPVLVLLAGCGVASFDQGPERTEDRSISAVSGVELATAGTLDLRTGDTPSLRITAGEKVLDDLTSEVSGDRLTLDADGRSGSLGDVTYELVLPDAHALELSGSGVIRVASPSAVEDVALSGSGELRIDGLATDTLTVDLSGSGQIAVAGEVDRQVVSLDGSGRYDGLDLASRDADVTIGGSGTADVRVSGRLDAVIEGSGSITHTGGADVHSQIAGSGTVTER